MTEKKYIRKTKNELYIKEQNQILDKFNDILNINQNNNYFVLNDIENNLEKQNQILNLIDDIKKYFVYNRWAYFNHKGDYLSLIKSIYKHMNYDVIYKQKKINNTAFILYYIIKKNF